METRFVSDGWHTRTTVPEAAAHVYTMDLNTSGKKLRVDLRDKMLVGGLPPEAPDGTMHMPRFFATSLDPPRRENDGGIWPTNSFQP